MQRIRNFPNGRKNSRNEYKTPEVGKCVPEKNKEKERLRSGLFTDGNPVPAGSTTMPFTTNYMQIEGAEHNQLQYVGVHFRVCCLVVKGL
jgi:hypothetical protein